MMKCGVPAPSSLGFELLGDDQAIIAFCEMAWEKQKIAFLTNDKLIYKSILLKNGWTTFSADEVDNLNLKLWS